MTDPLFFLSKSSQCYSLRVLSSDPPEVKDFFMHHFTNRDTRLGFPVFYDRVTQTPQGFTYNFSLRELGEAFLDKYPAKRLANYLKANSALSEQQEQIIKDVEDIPKGYHFAFAIRSSGYHGRFKFWQLYVPGLTFYDLKSIIPNKYQSKTEKNDLLKEDMPPGFSPLLIRGGENDFGDLLQKVIKQTYISERDYFLLKRSLARDNSFSDYLKNVSDIDRVAFYFFRKWIQPVLFFDNTSQWDSGDFDGLKVTVSYKGGKKRTETFEQYKLKEEHVFDMYPVLQDKEYPLPDNELFTKKQKRHKIEVSEMERLKLEEMLKGTGKLVKRFPKEIITQS